MHHIPQRPLSEYKFILLRSERGVSAPCQEISNLHSRWQMPQGTHVPRSPQTEMPVPPGPVNFILSQRTLLFLRLA